jgi:hypothetical protein
LLVKVIALLPARSALTVILPEVSNASEVEGFGQLPRSLSLSNRARDLKLDRREKRGSNDG